MQLLFSHCMKGDHHYVTQLVAYSLNKREVDFSVWSLTQPQPQWLSPPSPWMYSCCQSQRRTQLGTACSGCGYMPQHKGRGEREREKKKYSPLKANTIFCRPGSVYVHINGHCVESEKTLVKSFLKTIVADSPDLCESACFTHNS